MTSLFSDFDNMNILVNCDSSYYFPAFHPNIFLLQYAQPTFRFVHMSAF